MNDPDWIYDQMTGRKREQETITQKRLENPPLPMELNLSRLKSLVGHRRKTEKASDTIYVPDTDIDAEKRIRDIESGKFDKEIEAWEQGSH